MPSMKLTERKVRSLQAPNDCDYVRFWDTEVKGLCVKVLRSGRKKYEFKGKLRDRAIWAKDTPLCSDITVEGMRDQAREWRVQLRKGIDPWKKEPKAEIVTVSDLCRGNAESKRIGVEPASDSHLLDIRKLTDTVVGDRLGEMAAAEVTARDASKFLRQHARTTRKHDKLRWWLSNSFAFGIGKGLLPMGANPWAYMNKCYKLPEASELPRYSDGEIATLCSYLNRADLGRTERNYSPVWLDFMWFLILTGSRPGETLNIRREWVKTMNGEILIAHPHTKTGKKIIYLSAEAAALVKKILSTSRCDYLFPAKIDHMRNYATNYSYLRREAGLSKPPYAIRRWFARTGRLAFGGKTEPIQRLCSWESPEMAERYSGDDEELLENLIMENSEICRTVAKRVGAIVGKSLPNSYLGDQKGPVWDRNGHNGETPLNTDEPQETQMFELEARPGIEPRYEDLQSSDSGPLQRAQRSHETADLSGREDCQPDVSLRPKEANLYQIATRYRLAEPYGWAWGLTDLSQMPDAQSDGDGGDDAA